MVIILEFQKSRYEHVVYSTKVAEQRELVKFEPLPQIT